MNEQQAIDLVRSTLEASFEKARFIGFVKNLLNHVSDDGFPPRWGNYIPHKFEPFVDSFERVGTYSDGGNRIDILIVHLKKETSIERARSMQRNFVAGYLQGSYGSSAEKRAALVAFVSPSSEDWRFSLVKLDYDFVEQDGQPKAKEVFTPARRWSFLVGANEKSHTAQRRLVPIVKNIKEDPTLADLEKAFDIETVSDEFFLEYRDLFIRTKQALDQILKTDAEARAEFAAKGINTVDFAKKLLGQIIFLYYLQKKGWFGVPRKGEWGGGSKDFLRELFDKQHGVYQNFFNDILEPLFYDALRNDRSHDDHYYRLFNCKIPFLNGGLFDPIGNYDWVNTELTLPNALFSNSKETRQSDTGDGILDIFNRYNFTVREDEPYEKEVAIDPELLGKAYEKFNAIRPDNFDEYLKAVQSGKKGDETKFNKQYGVYYTPREIVYYMCQQSLIQYLHTALNVDIAQTDLETLILHGEQIKEHDERVVNEGRETKDYPFLMPKSIRANITRIDDKLAAITVCDPAVGSGAFPVGMMTEIVKARDVLSIYPSPIQGKQRAIYTFKRACIEHSLYGVDIDPGAVEIAKLRLWLSLVVDEDDIHNIKPLPNLDYKIVCGNSLVELVSPEFLAGTADQDRNALVAQLKAAKDELFNLTHPGQKEQKRAEIETFIHCLFENYKVAELRKLEAKIQGIRGQQGLFSDIKISRANQKKLKAWEAEINRLQAMQLPGPAEHFEWHINFSEVFDRDGFDIVIANPPYVTYHGRRRVLIDKKELEFLKKNYTCAFEKQKDGKYNSAMFFIERFVKLSSPTGLFCCITDISFYEHFYQGLKKYLLENANVQNVVNGLSSFENVASGQLIIIASKSQSKGDALKNIVRINNNGIQSKPILVKQGEWYNPENKYQFFIPERGLDGVYRKFEGGNKPLDFYFPNRLIRTGESVGVKEKGFVVNRLEGDSSVPIYEYLEGGKSVSERYSIPIPTRFFRFDVKLLNERNNHYRKDAIKNQRKNPKVLGIGDKLAFDNPKILIRQSSDHLCCTYTSKPYVYNRSYYSISSINSSGKSDVNLFYVLALLNSSLFTFYARKKRIIRMEQGKQPQIRLMDIKSLPIKMLINKEQKNFIDLVDRILTAKNANPESDTSALENEIDWLVYQLYDLTEEEIELVEASANK